MHECTTNFADRKLFNSNRSNRSKKHWWDKDCTTARDRNRLYHYIWKSMDRPTEGNVYDCYKAARKSYGKACKNAINRVTKIKYEIMDKLCREKNQPNSGILFEGLSRGITVLTI